MKLVLIEWLDSFGCSTSWQPLGTGRITPLRCQSVGWLVHDGDDCKVVVPHQTIPNAHVEAQGCGDMTIPTAAILSMRDLGGT